MSTIKISQLPAKGANLEATDLVEISEFNGSGYVSKSITGQEIIDAASGGGVTDVTATAPLSSSGGSTPDISIPQASTIDDGYLSSIDFSTFNAKQDELISGTNIKSLNGASLLGSGGLSVQPTLVSGTNIKTINSTSILGSGNIAISSGVTDVTGTDPIVSTGGATPDISIRQSGAADDGYLSTGDWNAFNNKQDALVSGVSIKTLNGASLLGSGGLSVQSTLVSGTNIKTINGSSVLGSGDLTISGGVTSVTGTSPIVSSGGATPAISIATANTSTTGALTSTDWNTFNGKQAALGFTPENVANKSVSVVADKASDIKYPSVKSVWDWVVSAFQPLLVSGSNIKTINSNSILGSGDLVVGGGGGTHVIVKPQTGNQVSALTASTNSGFNVGPIGFRMQAFPFYPASSFTSSSLTLNVTTLSAGGIARILIYSDVNGKPSVKLFESADLDCSTIGLKTASTAFNFVAGSKYWITVQSNNATTAFTLQPQNFSSIVSSFGLATRYTSYTLISIAIGSAPATWTGGTLHAFEFPFVYITSA